MNLLIILISIAIYIFGVTADVITSKQTNDGEGGTFETNPRYRTRSGDADIPKLIKDKFVMGGICLVVCLVLYFSGLDFSPFPKGMAFLLFIAVGLRHLQVAAANRKLLKK